MSTRISGIFLVFLFPFFVSCAEDDVFQTLLPQASQANKPAVVSTNPLDGRTGFDSSESVWVLFSIPMDELQTQQSFRLSSESGTIAGTFKWEGTKMTFLPQNAISGSGQYTLTIGRQAESRSGQDLGTDYIVRFFPNADTSRPYFVSSTPGAGATNVSPNSSIVLNFSEGIAFSSISEGISISPSFIYVTQQNAGRDVITIVPQAPLTNGTIYTINLNSKLKDLSGNPLLSEKTFTFVVGADFNQPSVTSTTSGALTLTDGVITNGVEKNNSLVLNFSEAMDQVSTEAAITLSPSVTRTYAWNGAFTQLTITPTTALDSETNYILSLGISARDQSGNTLSQNYSYPFFTNGPASVRPAVTDIRQEDTNYVGPSCDGNAGLGTYSVTLVDFNPLNTAEQMDEDPAGGSTICVVSLRITFNNNMVQTSLASNTSFVRIFDASGGTVNIWSITLAGNIMTLKLQGVPFPGGTGTPIYKLQIKGGAGGIYDVNGNTMASDYSIFFTF